jgi:Chlorophyll A-B binding protein
MPLYFYPPGLFVSQQCLAHHFEDPPRSLTVLEPKTAATAAPIVMVCTVATHVVVVLLLLPCSSALQTSFTSSALAARRVHRPSQSVCRMQELSNSELHASLRRRLNEAKAIESNQELESEVTLYDRQEMQAQYYRSFWKAKNLKRSSEEEVVTVDSGSSSSSEHNEDSGSLQTECSVHDLKQLHIRRTRPTDDISSAYSSSSSSSSSTDESLIYGWSAEELHAAYQSHYAMAAALRNIEDAPVATPTAAAAAVAGSSRFDWTSLQQPDFMARAEVKHMRVAIFAFIVCATRDCLSTFDVSTGFAHIDGLNSLLAVMVTAAAAAEANHFWGNGRSLEKQLEQKLLQCANFVATLLPEKITQQQQYSVQSPGQVAALARQAEVGHGRLAILYLLATAASGTL